jgi:hypothetical protein
MVVLSIILAENKESKVGEADSVTGNTLIPVWLPNLMGNYQRTSISISCWHLGLQA